MNYNFDMVSHAFDKIISVISSYLLGYKNTKQIWTNNFWIFYGILIFAVVILFQMIWSQRSKIFKKKNVFTLPQNSTEWASLNCCRQYRYATYSTFTFRPIEVIWTLNADTGRCVTQYTMFIKRIPHVYYLAREKMIEHLGINDRDGQHSCTVAVATFSHTPLYSLRYVFMDLCLFMIFVDVFFAFVFCCFSFRSSFFNFNSSVHICSVIFVYIYFSFVFFLSLLFDCFIKFKLFFSSFLSWLLNYQLSS